MAGIEYYSCEEEYSAAMDAEAQAEQEAYAAQCESEAEQEIAEQNQTTHNTQSASH